jgi:hypothetical protein
MKGEGGRKIRVAGVGPDAGQAGFPIFLQFFVLFQLCPVENARLSSFLRHSVKSV